MGSLRKYLGDMSSASYVWFVFVFSRPHLGATFSLGVGLDSGSFGFGLA